MTGDSTSDGTLYVAQSHVVYAFPLGATGTTAATRSITPHPNQDQYILGLAVNSDATLDVLEQFYAGAVEAATSGYCRVVVESATASGSSPALGTYLCDPQPTVASDGIAANTSGGYDVVYYDMQNHGVLRRFGSDGATVVNTLALNVQPSYLATDRGGHDYIDINNGNGRLESFKSTTTAYQSTQWDATFLGYGFGPMAVSPRADRTVYVVSGQVGGEYINVLAPGTSTISATLGPFDAQIGALAVDSAGSLYVALNPSTGTTGDVIRVYASGATGKPPPLRSIHPDPVMSAPITALAISEPV